MLTAEMTIHIIVQIIVCMYVREQRGFYSGKYVLHTRCFILYLVPIFSLLQVLQTEVVSVFKVAWVGKLQFEGPLCMNGKAISWHTRSRPERWATHVASQHTYLCHQYLFQVGRVFIPVLSCIHMHNLSPCFYCFRHRPTEVL